MDSRLRGTDDKVTGTFSSKSHATALLMLLCMLLSWAGQPSVSRAATITLMDEQLNLQTIALQSMDEQTITFFDEKGNYQTRSTSRFLQLRLKADPSTEKPTDAPQPAATSSNQPQPNAADHDADHDVEDAQEAIDVQDAQEIQDVELVNQNNQPAGQNPQEPNAQRPTAQDQTPALPQGWGIVELIDGQRLAGKLISSDDAGQLMQWEHPQAGLLSFKLDHVRQWRMNVAGQAVPSAASADGSDRLILANGDALSGFVSAVTLEAVSFIPQGAQDAVAIERSRIKALQLANAPLAEAAPTALVVLDDETKLRAKRVVIERGELRFAPVLGQSEQWVTLPLSSLRRLDFANERWQLLPWTALSRVTRNAEQPAGQPVDQAGSQISGMVFAAPWPVRQTADALHLHAPLTMTFTLPADTAAVAANAALDISPSDPAIGWADFVVSLHVDHDGDQPSTRTSELLELARLAINETHPQGRLHAKISQSNAASSTSRTRTLTLTLDPALNGPIMDRLKLTDAWVVVKRR